MSPDLVLHIHIAPATNATAAPRASIGAPVICDIPPVLVDEVIVPGVDVCDAVVSELFSTAELPVDSAALSEDPVPVGEVLEAVPVVAPAVMVTGSELMSVLSNVVV